jgi:outer membrane protein assembly factor BamE (lipoprotein component of BamABCDE complex)
MELKEFLMKSPQTVILSLTAISVLFVSGCMHSGQTIAPNKLSQIKKGQTTKSEVITLLGPPSFQSPGVMHYNSAKHNFAATAVVGIVPGAGLFTPNSMNSQNLQIWLDGRDVVKDVVINKSSSSGSWFSQVTGQTPIVTQTSGSQ